MLNMAIITGFLSKTKDRFHEYNQPLDLDQKFELMTGIHGYDGVEIVYPYEVNDPQETTELLKKHNLKVAAVNVNVKAEPEFRNGGLTSHDKDIRDKAVRFIKEAKDFAAGIGADKVTCCPLGDGYEFSFQYDYARTWKYLVDAFGEAGAGRFHLHGGTGGSHDLLLEEGGQHDGCGAGGFASADGVYAGAQRAGADDDGVLQLESEVCGLEVHWYSFPQVLSSRPSRPRSRSSARRAACRHRSGPRPHAGLQP